MGHLKEFTGLNKPPLFTRGFWSWDSNTSKNSTQQKESRALQWPSIVPPPKWRSSSITSICPEKRLKHIESIVRVWTFYIQHMKEAEQITMGKYIKV